MIIFVQPGTVTYESYLLDHESHGNQVSSSVSRSLVRLHLPHYHEPILGDSSKRVIHVTVIMSIDFASLLDQSIYEKKEIIYATHYHGILVH